EMIKREIDAKEDIEISFNPEKKSIYADIDYKQIKQVFYHLSINAIQSMHQGGKLIIKSCCKNSEIDISFIDTGEGIKKEIKEKIFYPFFTTRDRASGLGLALVHRIIEEHSGKIEVESKEGKGTRFSILLPMEE
ncbi:MAG: ATP-binding protein, partial [Nitrospirota bacterium]